MEKYENSLGFSSDPWAVNFEKSMLDFFSRGGVPVFIRPRVKPRDLEMFRKAVGGKFTGSSGLYGPESNVNQAA